MDGLAGPANYNYYYSFMVICGSEATESLDRTDTNGQIYYLHLLSNEILLFYNSIFKNILIKNLLLIDIVLKYWMHKYWMHFYELKTDVFGIVLLLVLLLLIHQTSQMCFWIKKRKKDFVSLEN